MGKVKSMMMDLQDEFHAIVDAESAIADADCIEEFKVNVTTLGGVEFQEFINKVGPNDARWVVEDAWNEFHSNYQDGPY